MATGDYFLITCEHGGNRIPSRYRSLFDGHERLLRTHRGYDPGALRLARRLAAGLRAPLLVSTVSRLLVDLNRSIGQPDLYSEASRAAAPELREEILLRYYLPYRAKAETMVAQAVAAGMRVVHISCHSFTPELNGEVRDADIGLLYDPARWPEQAFCRQWRDALARQAAGLRIRMNYPYAGTDDGFTVYLRQCFAEDRYLGIELEINQKHVLERGPGWQDLRVAVDAALQSVVRRDTERV